jgi:polar amino acid transport system permease protein
MLDQIAYAIPFLLPGLLVTIEVSLITVAVSTVIGVVLGMGLVYGPAPLRWPIRGFSDIIRGIPILVLLFFVYYGLPLTGLNLQSFAAAVLGLTIFKVAQVIEYVRGAIESVPRGQMDAAKAIGLPFHERLAYVIVPQAVRRFLPPWLNGVTDAVKGSALISLLGVGDLLFGIQKVVGRTYDPLALYCLGALLYFVMNYALSIASRALERRFSYIRE